MKVVKQLSTSNHLLACLPPRALQRVLTRLETVPLEYGQVLYEPEDKIRYVYFPVDCLVSLLTAVDKTRRLEVGIVDNEGIVGVPLALGVAVSAVRALVQGSGTALRMTSALFSVEFELNAPLRRALFSYTHLLMTQVSQTAACNRYHSAEERLARWLLMTSDGLQLDEFRLTQDLMVNMLGIPKAEVAEAAGALEQRKLIRYLKGDIVILRHQALEAAACACYRIVKDLQDGTKVSRMAGFARTPD